MVNPALSGEICSMSAALFLSMHDTARPKGIVKVDARKLTNFRFKFMFGPATDPSHHVPSCP